MGVEKRLGTAYQRGDASSGTMTRGLKNLPRMRKVHGGDTFPLKKKRGLS